MEIYQIRKWLWLGGGILLFVLIISYVFNHRSGNPLAEHTYTNSFTGTAASFYAEKGLEVQATGPTFVNSQALSVLGDPKAADTLLALKQFVNAQSHLDSRDPAITALHKNKDGSYALKLLLDSNEQVYGVVIRFDQQQIPTLTYTVDDDAKI